MLVILGFIANGRCHLRGDGVSRREGVASDAGDRKGIRVNTEAVLDGTTRTRVLPRQAATELAEERVRDALRFRRFRLM